MGVNVLNSEQKNQTADEAVTRLVSNMVATDLDITQGAPKDVGDVKVDDNVAVLVIEPEEKTPDTPLPHHPMIRQIGVNNLYANFSVYAKAARNFDAQLKNKKELFEKTFIQTCREKLVELEKVLTYRNPPEVEGIWSQIKKVSTASTVLGGMLTIIPVPPVIIVGAVMVVGGTIAEMAAEYKGEELHKEIAEKVVATAHRCSVDEREWTLGEVAANLSWAFEYQLKHLDNTNIERMANGAAERLIVALKNNEVARFDIVRMLTTITQNVARGRPFKTRGKSLTRIYFHTFNAIQATKFCKLAIIRMIHTWIPSVKCIF
jgi:hypothetical protein